jgi:hypothetical protein
MRDRFGSAARIGWQRGGDGRGDNDLLGTHVVFRSLEAAVLSLIVAASPAPAFAGVATLIEQASAGVPADPVVPAGPSVAECDAKLARYRAALDAGADPAVVAGWIADTQAERQRAEHRGRPAPVPDAEAVDALTTEQIIAIVEELGDMIAVLKEAEPEHKLQVYRSLGLHLTYDPDRQTVRAKIDLGSHRWDSVCVRGSTRTDAQLGIRLAGTLALT